jgi:hypothetical protein
LAVRVRGVALRAVGTGNTRRPYCFWVLAGVLLGYNREWSVPISEAYGLGKKVFWFEPEKEVVEWEKALGYLEAFLEMANSVTDSEPLIVARPQQEQE